MNYRKYMSNYKNIVKKNKDKEIIYIKGNNKVLISVPHGISQIRLGRYKASEKSTVPFAIELANRTNSNLIIKNKNYNDDANFDEKSRYKDKIMEEIDNYKYIIDIHGLSAKRNMDINLGTNIGNNIYRNPVIFDDLLQLLKDNGFIFTIDQPFKGGGTTISGTFSNYVWTLQIEINKKITAYKENKEKLSLLIDGFEKWINNIKEKTIKEVE